MSSCHFILTAHLIDVCCLQDPVLSRLSHRMRQGSQLTCIEALASTAARQPAQEYATCMDHGFPITCIRATTMKQFMWQPDLMWVAQFLEAGVRRMREADPSGGSDVQLARLAGTGVISCLASGHSTHTTAGAGVRNLHGPRLHPHLRASQPPPCQVSAGQYRQCSFTAPCQVSAGQYKPKSSTDAHAERQSGRSRSFSAPCRWPAEHKPSRSAAPECGASRAQME